MENKKIGIVALAALVIGFGMGSSFGGERRVPSQSGIHQMPDGTLMADDGMSMASMMADMNKALAGKMGDEFDRAFLAEMVVHHQGAVEMAELALENAKHEEVKALARAIIAAQKEEIADMSAWREAWYGAAD